MSHHHIRLSILMLIACSIQSIAMNNHLPHQAMSLHATSIHTEKSWHDNVHLKRAVGMMYGISVFTLSQIPQLVCSSSTCSPTANTLSNIISFGGTAIALFGACQIAKHPRHKRTDLTITVSSSHV